MFGGDARDSWRHLVFIPGMKNRAISTDGRAEGLEEPVLLMTTLNH